MEREDILSNNENDSFFDRLSSAIETTISQVNYTIELSRNFNKLKDETTFFRKELNLLKRSDDIYEETTKFYETVRDNPINANSIENRLLSLRAEMISLNENPVLIKKGLQPFIPVRSNVSISESSYISPVSNRSQSLKNSFHSARMRSSKKSSFETPRNISSIIQKSSKKSAYKEQEPPVNEKPSKPDRCEPASYDSPPARDAQLPSKFNLAASVKKSARKLTHVKNINESDMQATQELKPLGSIDMNISPNHNEPDSVFKRNFSNPELKNVMARLAAWTTQGDDENEDDEGDKEDAKTRNDRIRTRTFILRKNA